ncbi:hypothetical protein [Actinoplanes sp. NPDC049265]|uniref:hypothetical protein n=1 Tax=Actinoplanes sp. NPDC049265 TaxID=3363902 RepID=UPI003713633A
MWPWRRKQEEPAPAPVSAPVVPPRPPADQWRLVAPIQRVVGDDILANPVQRFSGSLSAWQDPRFVGALGHGVSAGEPSGTIGEFARPSGVRPDLPAGSLPEMPVAASQPERPARPVNFTVSRLAETPPADEPSPVEAAPQPGAGVPSADQAEAPEQAAAPTLGASAPPVQDPEGTPEADDSGDAVQRIASSGAALPPVQRSASTGAALPPVQRTATDAALPLASAPAPSAQRTAGDSAAVQRMAADDAATAQRMTDAAAVQRNADAAAGQRMSDENAAVQRMADDNAAQRSAGDNATAPVQRAADDATPAGSGAQPPPVQRVAETLAQRSAETPVQRAADQTAAAAQRAAEAAGTPLQRDLDLPLQRATDTSAHATTSGWAHPAAGASAQPGADASVQRAGSPQQAAEAPVQRVADGEAAPAQRSAENDAPLLNAPIQRALDDDEPGVQRVAADTPGAVAHDDHFHLPVQRSAAPEQPPRLGLGAPIEPAAQHGFDGGSRPFGPGDDLPPAVQRFDMGGDVMPLAAQRFDEGGGAVPDAGFESVRPVHGEALARPVDVPAAPGTATGPDSPAMPLSPPSPVQRLGLGAALDESSPLLSPPAPTLASSPIASALSGATGPGETSGPAVQRIADDIAEPELPVAVTHGAPAAGGGPVVPVPAPSAPTASASAAPVLPVVSRLVGDRPLRPALADLPAAQASATGASIASGPSPAELPAVPVAQLVAEPPAGAPVRTAVPLQTYSTPGRGSDGGGPGVLGSLGDGGFGAMPTVSGSGAPSVQRSAMPAAASPAMQLLTARPAAETPSSSPYADPNYFDAPPITVSRQVTVSASADNPVPTVSRAEDAAATPDPAPAAPAAPAAPGAPGGAAAAATQPDELVKKLFDPLLRRLKAELRLDRERRGSLTDLRH